MNSIFPSADIPKKEDISRMMNELMEAFSKEINALPDQYFWYNKRWVLDPKITKFFLKKCYNLSVFIYECRTSGNITSPLFCLIILK